MKQPRAKLAGAIAAQTLSTGKSKNYSRQIAAYLLSEGRVSELESIMRDVQTSWAESGFVEVIARSAHDIPAATQAKIAKQAKALYPNAKKVVVTPVLDPSVLGGVQITVASQQLDLSVEAKLNRFKQLTRNQQ